MKKQTSILILLGILATAAILTADTIANITAHNDRSLTIDKGSSDGVQIGMRGKIQVVGKDAVGQYELTIGEFLVKKVYGNSAEIYAERVESGKNLEDASFVVFESTLKASSFDSTTTSPAEIGTKPSSGTNIKDEAARIQEIISLIQSSAQKKQWKNWQASLSDYSNAINLYNSLGKEVKTAVEQSDARVIGTLYSQRGFCRFQLKDIEGAVADWKIAEKYGCRDDEVVLLTKNEYFRLEAEFQDEMNRRAEMERARQAALVEAELWEEEEEESEVPSLSETLAKGLQEIADGFRQNQEVIQEIKRRREEQKEQLLEQENQRRQAVRDQQAELQRQREQLERQRSAEQERQRLEQERIKREQEEVKKQIEDTYYKDELSTEWNTGNSQLEVRTSIICYLQTKSGKRNIASIAIKADGKRTESATVFDIQVTMHNYSKYCKFRGDGYFHYNGAVVKEISGAFGVGEVLLPGETRQGSGVIYLPKEFNHALFTFKPFGYAFDCKKGN